MTDTLKGYLLMTGFAFMIMLSYLSIDYVFRNYPGITPENAIVWGLGSASVFVAPFFLRNKVSRKKVRTSFDKHFILLLIISLFTALGGFLWFYALEQSNSGVLSLLSKTETLWGFFLGVLFLRERITFLEIVGVLVSVGGICLISSLKGEVSLLAVLAVIVGKFFYGFQSLLVKKYARDLEAFSFTFIRGTLMSFFLFLMFFIQDKLTFIPLSVFWILVISQVVGLFLARICYFEAHKLLDVSKLNTFLFLEPVFVLIGAFFVFGDTVSGQKLLGAIFVLGGLLFFVHQQMKVKNLKHESR